MRRMPSVAALIIFHLLPSRASFGGTLFLLQAGVLGFRLWSDRCGLPAGWKSSEAQRRCDRSSQSQLSKALQLDAGPQEASPSGRLPALGLYLDHLHQQVGSVGVVGAAAVCQPAHMTGTRYSNGFIAPVLT